MQLWVTDQVFIVDALHVGAALVPFLKNLTQRATLLGFGVSEDLVGLNRVLREGGGPPLNSEHVGDIAAHLQEKLQAFPAPASYPKDWQEGRPALSLAKLAKGAVPGKGRAGVGLILVDRGV
jgi:hypothetical protein